MAAQSASEAGGGGAEMEGVARSEGGPRAGEAGAGVRGAHPWQTALPVSKRLKHTAIAEWDRERNLAVVRLPRGKLLQSTGFNCGPVTYLFIEEAIFLLERGDLELLVDGMPCSVQEAYTFLHLPARLHGIHELADEVQTLKTPIVSLRTYNHLRALGYIVRRTTLNEWGYTPPERLRVQQQARDDAKAARKARKKMAQAGVAGGVEPAPAPAPAGEEKEAVGDENENAAAEPAQAEEEQQQARAEPADRAGEPEDVSMEDAAAAAAEPAAAAAVKDEAAAPAATEQATAAEPAPSGKAEEEQGAAAAVEDEAAAAPAPARADDEYDPDEWGGGAGGDGGDENAAEAAFDMEAFEEWTYGRLAELVRPHEYPEFDRASSKEVVRHVLKAPAEGEELVERNNENRFSSVSLVRTTTEPLRFPDTFFVWPASSVRGFRKTSPSRPNMVMVVSGFADANGTPFSDMDLWSEIMLYFSPIPVRHAVTSHNSVVVLDLAPVTMPDLRRPDLNDQSLVDNHRASADARKSKRRKKKRG